MAICAPAPGPGPGDPPGVQTLRVKRDRARAELTLINSPSGHDKQRHDKQRHDKRRRAGPRPRR